MNFRLNHLTPVLVLLSTSLLPSSALAQLGTTGSSLAYHNGKIVAKPVITSVYWGSYWNTNQGTSERTQIDTFMSFLAGSSDFTSIFQQYPAQGQTYSGSTYNGGKVYTGPLPQVGGSFLVQDKDVQSFLLLRALDATIPWPTFNTITIVFLPPTVTALDSGFARLCGPGALKNCDCGYHSADTFLGSGGFTGNISTHAGWGPMRYVVIPYLGLSTTGSFASVPACPFTSPSAEIQNYTATITHEVAETITNPDTALASIVPPDPNLTAAGISLSWFDNKSKGEIGDLCTGWTSTIQGHTVQKLWSNLDKACVSAVSDYTISAPDVTIARGAQGTTTIRTTKIGPSTLSVSVSSNAVVHGVTIHPAAPRVLSDGGQDIVTISVASTVAKGVYPITMNSSTTTPVRTRSFTFNLTVD